MSEVVLDASAVLALLAREAGAERVEALLLDGRCLLSTVNLIEVLTRLLDRGVPREEARSVIDDLELEIVPLDQALAAACADLRTATH